MHVMLKAGMWRSNETKKNSDEDIYRWNFQTSDGALEMEDRPFGISGDDPPTLMLLDGRCSRNCRGSPDVRSSSTPSLAGSNFGREEPFGIKYDLQHPTSRSQQSREDDLVRPADRNDGLFVGLESSSDFDGRSEATFPQNRRSSLESRRESSSVDTTSRFRNKLEAAEGYGGMYLRNERVEMRNERVEMRNERVEMRNERVVMRNERVEMRSAHRSLQRPNSSPFHVRRQNSERSFYLRSKAGMQADVNPSRSSFPGDDAALMSEGSHLPPRCSEAQELRLMSGNQQEGRYRYNFSHPNTSLVTDHCDKPLSSNCTKYNRDHVQLLAGVGKTPDREHGSINNYSSSLRSQTSTSRKKKNSDELKCSTVADISLCGNQLKLSETEMMKIISSAPGEVVGADVINSSGAGQRAPTSEATDSFGHIPASTSHSPKASSSSQTSSPPDVRPTLARSHVPKRHSTKDLCMICGDKASGYHYNTLSCEGCKGFFRRTIARNLHYQCKYGGNCVMDMWMRRKCPACRLTRCKQVGMREECLLSEHQCVIRNSRRRLKMRLKKKETIAPDPQTAKDSNQPHNISVDDTQAILDSLNSEQKDLIERLVNLQDKYELPSTGDIGLLREDKMHSASTPEDLSDAIFLHMVEMTILVTRLIVEFAKCLPGFRNLIKEDQIVLLKSSSSEVMMLRTARRYRADTNTIVFGNGVPFSPTSMAFGGLQESVESLFEFSKSMSGLYVDNAEYALLTAMCIFSVRSGLMNPSVVDKLQEVYMDVLLAYVGKRRTKCRHFLPKLLMKLVHLRTLGYEHSQTLYNLTLKRGSLPPLLTEFFDI